MKDNNIVEPTFKSGLIVVIQMRPGRYSVGSLNVDQTVARFPWDWDEQPKEDALSIARELASGMDYTKRIADMGWYEMPYPIKRK